MHDGANQEEYQRLKNSVVKIKMMVYRTSLQFKLPYSEVLKRAAEKHKEDKPVAAKAVGLPQEQPSPQQPSPQQQQQQQQQQPPTLTVQLPQQPVAVSPASANHSSPSLPVILAQSTPSDGEAAATATTGRPTPVVLSPQVSRPFPTPPSAPAVAPAPPGRPASVGRSEAPRVGAALCGAV